MKRHVASGGWNVIIKRDINAKRSAQDLIVQLSKEVSDSNISLFFNHPIQEFTFQQSLSVLKLLGKSCKRSSALEYSPVLKNKIKWMSLVDSLSKQCLKPSTGIADDHLFVELCCVLSKYRLGTCKQVKLLSYSNSSLCFPHLLRYCAEIDDPIEALLPEIQVFVSTLNMRPVPAWLPSHLALSLAILVRDKQPLLTSCKEIQTLNSFIWNQVKSPSSNMANHDLLDLFDASKVLQPSGSFANLFQALKAETRSKETTTSRFQQQVSVVLAELKIPFESEALHGKLDFYLPNLNVGLQCYGPTHYLFKGVKKEGRTCFQEFLLSPLVLKSIDFVAWEGVTSLKDKKNAVLNSLGLKFGN
jgi:hypothetical protein